MADIFQEVEEDLRRDRYERLAQKYGGYVIVGLLLIVAGTAGYVVWKGWRETRRQSDTLKLSEAVDSAAAGSADAAATLSKVVTEVEAGPAVLARFYGAGAKAKGGDNAGAIAIYEAVAGDGTTPGIFRDLAVLLSVQLQVSTGDGKTLEARLVPLSADAGPWRFSARELTGLLAARAGDQARAKTLFQQLADDNGAPAGLRARAAELAAFFGRNP